jgi:hypothetical protein
MGFAASLRCFPAALFFLSNDLKRFDACGTFPASFLSPFLFAP